MSRDELYEAILALCQDFGITSSETHAKVDELLDTITTDIGDVP